MAEATVDKPQLREADAEDAVQYRSVSPLAVLSLALGAASAAALVHPLFWVLPLLAIGMSIFSLWSIASRKAEVVGRGVALVGLWLAIFFGVWAPARLISRQVRLSAEARAFAQEWFDLVRSGDQESLCKAYELHLHEVKRQGGDQSLAEFYGDLSQPAEIEDSPAPMEMRRPDPKANIRKFFGTETIKKVIDAGPGAEIVFVANESQTNRAEMESDDVELLFELRSPTPGAAPLPLPIKLTRTYDSKKRRASWHVAHVADAAGR